MTVWEREFCHRGHGARTQRAQTHTKQRAKNYSGFTELVRVWPGRSTGDTRNQNLTISATPMRAPAYIKQTNLTAASRSVAESARLRTTPARPRAASIYST